MAGKNTLTITDDRTGKSYELPIENGTIRATRPAQDQGRPPRLRPDVLRSGVHEYRLVQVGDHVHRRRQGNPRIPGISDRGARREVHLPRGRVSPLERRVADSAELKEFTHHVTTHTLLHENVKKLMDGFSHDAHPMGMLLSTVGAISTFYPGRASKSSTRRRATITSAGSSRRCPPLRPSPTGTASASRTSIRTTSCPTRETS